MEKPLITIGMAHFEDFNGVYFTVGHLQFTNSLELLKKCELVIIDNSPLASGHADGVRGVLKSSEATFHSCKYVPMATPVGTSPSRNRIFDEASGEIVIVMDCHILTVPNFIQSVLDLIDIENPENKNIYSGPLIYDHLSVMSTHYSDTWRGEMWGTWGTAYRCSCSLEKGSQFDMMQIGETAIARKLEMGVQLLESCENCGKTIPRIPWAGHEQKLLQNPKEFVEMCPAYNPQTTYPVGTEFADEFEVPGQGLGMFIMRKNNWPGFNKYARQFGGEELYIHEKVRQRGGKAICGTKLGWKHRFHRPEGVRYPIDLLAKVRNYILELTELGLPLDPCYDHFVKTGKLSDTTWNELVAHVETYDVSDPEIRKTLVSMKPRSVEEIYRNVLPIPRDLNEHMPLLASLSGYAKTVLEISYRKESTIGIMAGKPTVFDSFNAEYSTEVMECEEFLKDTTQFKHYSVPDGDIVNTADLSIGKYGLIFIDTQHTHKHVLKELKTYQSVAGRFMVIHDTDIFKDSGADGSHPGLAQAIQDFINSSESVRYTAYFGDETGQIKSKYHSEDVLSMLDQNKNGPKLSKSKVESIMEHIRLWNVAFQATNQYGITVLSNSCLDLAVLPGQELKALLYEMGQRSSPTCSCNTKAIEIDKMGLDAAWENIQQVVDMLKDGMESWGWRETISRFGSGVLAGFMSGNIWSINPTSPLRSVIEIALERCFVKRALRNIALAEAGLTEKDLVFKYTYQ